MTDIRSHFPMSSLPFTCEIPCNQGYRTAAIADIEHNLKQTVENRMSAALIGPAGCGKTFILRSLRDSLPEARYKVRYVKVTDLSKRDMCRELAAAVGIQSVGNYPSLVRRLQDAFKSSLIIDGSRPVVMIDEAHDMRPDVLAMLRLLTNFEMDSQLVVSVLMAGQPPLKRMLMRDELAGIARRLAWCGTLPLLTREETAAYVRHRLSIVGAEDEYFPLQVVEALYEMTRGNLRAIDYLALACLHMAADRGEKVVSLDLVNQARKKVVQ